MENIVKESVINPFSKAAVNGSPRVKTFGEALTSLPIGIKGVPSSFSSVYIVNGRS